jgi:riboflavin kinase/FMN adenylyltransferase
MRIIPDARTTIERFPKVVLTIGSFDGVHLGHRRILEEVVRAAREMCGTPAVMSLRPHPRQFFSPKDAPNILTCDAKKEDLLEEAGIGVLYVLPFNREVANLSPEAFVEQIVVGRCHASQLIVGHDFCFGKDARGDYEFLKQCAPQYSFGVSQAPQLVIHGERVSSTLIRECILEGEMESVEMFLGRKYSIVGVVGHGRGIGKTLGFPTANVEPLHSAVPPHGVYVAEVLLRPGKERYRAAVNIGVAPTIRHEDMVVEAHLLDYEGDIAGRAIEVVFHKRLRPEKRFDSREELIEAIAADVRAVRGYFAAQPG